MNILKPICLAAVLMTFALLPLAGRAEDKKETPKTYPLKTCVVSGEKLGEMGDPYVFTYKGREIKFCCKGCLKDFNKEPAKYIKLIEEAEAKAKAKPEGRDPKSEKTPAAGK